MTLSKIKTSNNLVFYTREGTSDQKTIIEVIEQKAYQRMDFKIEPGSNWLDLGGNIGAFTVLAASLGADVTVYEPDPYNCEMISKNLAINGLSANVVNEALIHDDRKELILFIGNNNQFWRNSLVKKWNNKGIKVKCSNFFDVYGSFSNCKMDIEGSEMLILEKMVTKQDTIFNQLVFEWSFDIDSSIPRLHKLLMGLHKYYILLNPELEKLERYMKRNIYKWEFARACTTVFLKGRNDNGN